MEDEDEFFDVNSLTSYNSVNRRKANGNRDYIALSRNTIYHSAVDLEMELDNLVAPSMSHQNKSWRSFSNTDLCVDFVLAYEDTSDRDVREKRQIFERQLEEIGLLLEKEENQRIHFVKIHAPREVLCRYAEILKLRLPIKDDIELPESRNLFNALVCKVLDFCHVRIDATKFPPQKYQLTAEFSRDKNYLFDVNCEGFFNTSVRITIVYYILQREKFGDEEHDKGIKRLLTEGVYKGAYPLHDGDLDTKGCQRQLLADEWASVSKWIKFQPVDNVKDYFGVKFALYFAWLGFYTHMLIPAAVVGFLCVLYAWATLADNSISNDICSKNIIMCPLCDTFCDYWQLNESCTFAKIAHFVDNPATIFFSVFMSFWAALYLELWKRYSAEVTHRWGLTGFDLQAEHPRPEFLTRLARAKKKKLNVVTQLCEPVVPFWRVKVPSIVLSFTVALLWILLAVAVVFGVVVYRMAVITSQSIHENIYVVPITAGIINLICILVLNSVYDRLAEWLTEMELQRTQTEFDDSLALKIYMFQFVNYYTCIFYIAFLKGKFVGYPAKYNRLFGYRQEECNPGGCLMELTIQLAIIMIGNQAINAVMEMVVPLLKKMYNTFKITAGLEKDSSAEIISCNQWTEDYKLSDIEPRGLFQEYLEMVLQYGFVTIFVTAFPLAPLFALINNIFEMRLDAKKIIKYYRRPVPQRVKNIGVWFPIMDVLGRISVVSNAFIIAFSSHFIPRLVYSLKLNTRRTDAGFLEHSLSYFNVEDFPAGYAPTNPTFNVTTCRYFEYRNPPDHEQKYKRPLEYWHILAARLAFIVVYQNVVSFVIMAVQWAIPDVPRKLADQIKREAYRTNEIIIKHEAYRARERTKHKDFRDSVVSEYVDANGDMFPEEPNILHHRNSFRNSNHLESTNV